jgi:hypothetical protein
VRLSRTELRVIEVGVGLVSALAGYQTGALCIALAINPTGVAIWLAVLFAVFEGVLALDSGWPPMGCCSGGPTGDRGGDIGFGRSVAAWASDRSSVVRPRTGQVLATPG